MSIVKLRYLTGPLFLLPFFCYFLSIFILGNLRRIHMWTTLVLTAYRKFLLNMVLAIQHKFKMTEKSLTSIQPWPPYASAIDNVCKWLDSLWAQPSQCQQLQWPSSIFFLAFRQCHNGHEGGHKPKIKVFPAFNEERQTRKTLTKGFCSQQPNIETPQWRFQWK